MTKLPQLNFFIDAQTESESETHRQQIITTRLYIILWIISVLFLSIYFGLSSKTVVVFVDSPTLNYVNQLQSSDLNELSCPCTKITIPFGTFTTLNVTAHQVHIQRVNNKNNRHVPFCRFVQVIWLLMVGEQVYSTFVIKVRLVVLYSLHIFSYFTCFVSRLIKLLLMQQLIFMSIKSSLSNY